jgi:hypothetical protein
VKVGHRQATQEEKPQSEMAGVFCFGRDSFVCV